MQIISIFACINEQWSMSIVLTETSILLWIILSHTCSCTCFFEYLVIYALRSLWATLGVQWVILLERCCHHASVELAQAHPDEAIHSLCCDVFFNLVSCQMYVSCQEFKYWYLTVKKGVTMPLYNSWSVNPLNPNDDCSRHECRYVNYEWRL